MEVGSPVAIMVFKRTFLKPPEILLLPAVVHTVAVSIGGNVNEDGSGIIGLAIVQHHAGIDLMFTCWDVRPV